MEILLRNTDSKYLEHNNVSRIWIVRTSHHKAHRAHWITGWDLLEFITLWKTAECFGKRSADYSSFLLDSHGTTCRFCGH